jgi:OFA family oxalate/formate antiporter-like MFS transporter
MGAEVSLQRVDKLRWVTLILQILVGTSAAYVYCLSVYIGPLAEKFGWDPATLVIAYSAMMIVAAPGSIVGGKLKEKFGNRNVLKVGGICFAICVVASSFATTAWLYVILNGGCASFFMYVVYVAQLGNVGELFPDKRGMAMGVTIGGISFGTAAIIILAEWLTRIVDVMQGIRMQGIVYGALIVFVGFVMTEAPKGYRPAGWTPDETGNPVAGELQADGPDIGWKKMLLCLSFWIFFLANMFVGVFGGGLQSNMSLIIQQSTGVDPQQAAVVYSAFQLVMGVSGILIGIISDKKLGAYKTMILICGVVGVGALVFWATGSSQYTAAMISCVIIGFGLGGIMMIAPTYVMNMYGSARFGVNYGIMLLSATIGSVVGPQLAVRLPVSNLFLIGVILPIAGGLFMLLAIRGVKKAHGERI